jgi:hypothetical protein
VVVTEVAAAAGAGAVWTGIINEGVCSGVSEPSGAGVEVSICASTAGAAAKTVPQQKTPSNKVNDFCKSFITVPSLVNPENLLIPFNAIQ